MAALMLGLAAAFLWLALHPFTTFPLSLRWLAGRGVGWPGAGVVDVASTRPLTFAVFTCAYNEERVIEAKIRNLLSLRERHPALEILVYVDAASDRTAAICEQYAGQISLHVSQNRNGKTHGMNLLVRQSQADILIFTDANVMLAPDVIERAEAHFGDPDVGCVCGNLTYVNADASVTARSGSLYWRIEEAIKRLESATGGVIGADGSLFAMRRSLHRPPPDHIIDDFYLSLMVMCQGARVVQALDVKAFEETVAVSSEEFRRKIRIACQAFNVHRLLWPRIARLDALTVYKYVSHKLLRWLSIFSLAAALIFAMLGAAIGGWWLLAALLALGPVVVWAFGSRWPVRPFPQIYDILSAFAGTGIGVWRSLQGERFQTWAPAASLRK
ncbi:glycosyltransferase family 2 protein [Variovorax sp. LT1P1]|uniref:glycosyltransferase family 2 protein n=1 Tax=Variovorax sp. LT1P1 TaxID=3443730 RepID=UPI003F472F81